MKTIVLVDDDTSIRDTAKMILESQGYRVITSPDGGCLDDIGSKASLIILDLILSDRNGSEICLTLKTQKDTSHVPVLLISAERELRSEVLRCHADGCLQKPFGMDDLLRCVERYAK